MLSGVNQAEVPKNANQLFSQYHFLRGSSSVGQAVPARGHVLVLPLNYEMGPL